MSWRDNDLEENISRYKGKAIKRAFLAEKNIPTTDGNEHGYLRIEFYNLILNIWDEQDCCEQRYFTTDDDLDYYSNSILFDISVESGNKIETDYGVHEINFLHVKTSKGVFVLETHNKHNGYYGGMCLKCEENAQTQ